MEKFRRRSISRIPIRNATWITRRTLPARRRCASRLTTPSVSAGITPPSSRPNTKISRHDLRLVDVPFWAAQFDYVAVRIAKANRAPAFGHSVSISIAHVLEPQNLAIELLHRVEVARINRGLAELNQASPDQDR